MTRRIGDEFHVVFPLWGPVGGVIKIFDYLHHTLQIGFDRAIAWGPPLPGPEAPIRDHAAYRRAHDDPRIEFRLLKDLELPESAWVLFSEPSQHPDIEEALPDGSNRQRVIHLVQNTRHANPHWHLGFPYLLLHRPLTRIHVTHEVAEAVTPVVNTRFPSTTIVEGHDWPFFSTPSTRDPEGPLRVGYTTWKSTIGDEVADALQDDSRFSFDAIRSPATWIEIRELYHRSDVWLCSPGPEEGFYLPGLEAMAANLIVVSPFVGGNRAYLIDEENCLRTEFEDPSSHVRALKRLADDPELGDRLRAGGHAATARHTLERERAEFGEFIAKMAELA
ncbi:MAG: glycosyltransferase [Acidimicrobiales bacterium]